MEKDTQPRKHTFNMDNYKRDAGEFKEAAVAAGFTPRELIFCYLLDKVIDADIKIVRLAAVRPLVELLGKKVPMEMKLLHAEWMDTITLYINLVEAGIIDHDELLKTSERLDVFLADLNAQKQAKAAINVAKENPNASL